jgi:hypothetical protein
MPIPSRSPAWANGCTSPLLRSTSRPTSPTWSISSSTRISTVSCSWATAMPVSWLRAWPTGSPQRISQLVYLDTGLIPNGTALIETFPTEARRHIEQQVEKLGDGWRFPIPPQEELATFGSLEGLDEARLELLRSRSVDQPFATFTQPLELKNPAREALPKVGILCSFSLEEVQAIIDSGNPVFREMASPNWRFVELPTGHYPMFSRPDDLAVVLLELLSGASTQDDERST